MLSHKPTGDSPPIPSIAMPGDWQTVPIQECGEPLIDLRDVDCPAIRAVPGYALRNLRSALHTCYLRKGVWDRLAHAAMYLPEGFAFLIYDGWRPVDLQQELFDDFYARLVPQHPTATADELIERTRKYVSLPSVHPDHPSPHLTGGSIDLTIIDTHGQPLDMGTDWDAFTPLSSTAYYENLQRNALSDTNLVARRKNRRLLYRALTKSGFTNYPEEWWHYDFGNQFWARLRSGTAIYGAKLDIAIRPT